MKALTIFSLGLGVLSIVVCLTLLGGFFFAVPGVMIAHFVRWKTPVTLRSPQLNAALATNYVGLGLAVLGFVYLAFMVDWK